MTSHRVPMRAERYLEGRPADTREGLQRHLSQKQRNFAECRARGMSLQKAARFAGYNVSNSNSARAVGYELAHDPQIAALIAFLTRSFLQSATGVAAGVLVDVAKNGEKDADRVKAANSILARGAVPVSQDIAVEHSGTVQHRPALTMNDLRRQAGLPELPEKPALPSPDPSTIVDAEFEPITPAFEDVEW